MSKEQRGLLLVAIFTNAGCLVVFCTVIIRTVIEGAVLLSNWPPSTLVLKVPVKAGKWLVLRALMLNEQWTLLNAKLFQIPEEGQGGGLGDVRRERTKQGRKEEGCRKRFEETKKVADQE